MKELKIKKPTLKELKNRIEAMLDQHRAAGWTVRTSSGVLLYRHENGKLVEHYFTRREYADKFCM